jgi:hypothetical protein
LAEKSAPLMSLQVAVHVAGIDRVQLPVGVAIFNVVHLAALAAELKAHRAAVDFDVPVAQRGKPER